LDIIRTGGEDTPTHHRIYRVDTDNGEYHWYYYQPKAPRSLNVFKNRLLLQYNDEVRVLSYLSM
jgi:hypothetical protein